jgi:ATP-dependent RNA helicase DeaD
VSVLIVPHPKRRRAEQVIHAARVRAAWASAPGAEDIRARDHERLLTDPMLAVPEGQERADAEALLAANDPVAIAAALLRLYRRGLPAPEEISQAPQAAAPKVRPAASGVASGYVQFRISVGRNNRADPKWIVPLLCRLGGVTKQDIGAIRVFDTDTRFEISRDAAAGFTAAVAGAAPNEPRITSAGDGPMPPRQFRHKPAGAMGRKRRG